MNVKTVKELPVSGSGAKQVLVKKGRRYFVVSSVYVSYSGFETLVFPADEKGKVTRFLEVAGGRGASREEAIADLSKRRVLRWKGQS